MNPEDKKKIAFIAVAALAGLIAVVLTGNYIERNVKEQTTRLIKAESARLEQEYETKRIRPLQKRIDELDQELKKAQALMARRGTQGGVQQATPQGSLAVKTPKGKRAITLKIDALAAVGGLIHPGDFVDVMAHLYPKDSKAKKSKSSKKTSDSKVTVMVFQKVEVLAVNTNVTSPGAYTDQQKAKQLNVTLALNPDEVGLISFAQQHGDLQLVLRSPDEKGTNKLQASNWETLSDYVLENTGIELPAGDKKAVIRSDTEELEPYIQIFRGGR